MNSTFAKLVLVLLAAGTIISYIQPTWMAIDAQQDQIDLMETAIANANRNNDELRRLSDLEQSLSPQSKIDLDIFLPRTIDPLQVMADVTTIGQLSRVDIKSISTGQATEADPDVVNQSGERASVLSTQDFTLQVSGSYDQFKTFLRNLERNKYLLEVVNVSFVSVASETASDSDEEMTTRTEEGVYTLTVRAYAYHAAITSNANEQ